MDFTFADSLIDYRDRIKDFVDNKVDGFSIMIEEEDCIPPEVLCDAKSLGLFGLSIPSDYGGIGTNMVGKCLIFEQLGRTNNGFTTLIGAHNGVGTVGLVELGNEEQKRRLLPSMATGEKIGAFALSEPESGSAAVTIKTQARRIGDRYVLNGVKSNVTNGPEASVITILAVTDESRGSKGITAFLVEKGAKGLRLGSIDRKMGLRGSHSCSLILEDCEVPTENVLGKEGDGYVNSLRVLTNGRVGLAARNLGSMQKLLELAVKHTTTRYQAGSPISRFQAVQHLIADIGVDVETTRSLTYLTAWMVDQGLKVAKESAMVKYYASEAYCRVADKTMQIFGGLGYLKDAPIERFYRDARIARIAEGTSEIQKNIIAEQLFKEFGAKRATAPTG
ncbi:acyl-CoA dehydrogenase [Desulfosporosinus sp. Tol-M]|nr:acyl-CoA dehydrogenase [Desulfosporosinus sp. Tol-M]